MVALQFNQQEKMSFMMEVMDESALEKEMEEADKVGWSSRSMAKIYISSFSFDCFLILSFIIISCHLYPILISKHLSLSDLDHTHKAPASKVPWNLVGLGVGVCAAFLLVVICCDIKV